MSATAGGRVFISHTTASNAFAGAAIEACNEAGWVPVDMRWFSAADRTPTANDRLKVEECDVFVAILGLDYGSPTRDRPDRSYCELEWDDATTAGLTRLAYLRRGESTDDRQASFRQRVLDSDLTADWFETAEQLQHKLFKALSELPVPERTDSTAAMNVRVERNEGVIAQEISGPITFNRGSA
ncbi:MAG: DUF4062 domain-containing protein [Actinomycetota bacterium]|nr:DUF4062 domain-containing protein [Actinomycetota bacterium]